MERTREPMSKNRSRPYAWDERAYDREVLHPSEEAWGRFGGCAWKAVGSTPGDLPSVPIGEKPVRDWVSREANRTRGRSQQRA